jgi:hypothetical protein
MALWQFVLDLVPASAANVGGMPAARMSREQLDTVSLGFSNADAATLFVRLQALLPEKKSWSQSLRIWGDEKTDDIQVWMDDKLIEGVQFRLDVSHLSLALVGGICAVARHFNCVLATRDGAIIQPNRETVIRMILASPAMRFVRDPQRYLEEAVRLDESDC